MWSKLPIYPHILTRCQVGGGGGGGGGVGGIEVNFYFEVDHPLPYNPYNQTSCEDLSHCGDFAVHGKVTVSFLSFTPR